MAETVRSLTLDEEMKIAEEQTPGHKASRGPGDTIVLTPEQLTTEQRNAQLARRAGVLELLDDSAA